MKIDTLIARLDRVRPSAIGQWIACCPAHDDKEPSLALKDAGNGMILIHCFTGCSVQDICAALNIEISELMPDKTIDYRIRPQTFDPVTVLECLSEKAMVFAIYAADVAKGKILTQDEKQKVFDIAVLFNQAIGYAKRSQTLEYRRKYRL